MAARARGVVGVAVAVDLVEVDALALGELVASGRCHPDLADRITIAPVELPRRDVGQGAQDRPGDGAGLVVADHGDADTVVVEPERRSEEHTSELQSLMRISYAVFCLKKKK